MTARPAGRRRAWTIGLLFGLSVLLVGGGFGDVVLSVQSFTVPSGSMEGTVAVGDHVLVDRTSDVRRGDVVVIMMPGVSSASRGPFLRRVIGVGGDHVALDGGKVTVNGKALDENYLYPGDAPSQMPFRATVPAGGLWLMGDHRSISNDSRFSGRAGEARDVVGRAFVAGPVSGLHLLGTPRTFLASGLATARSHPPIWILGLCAGFVGSTLLTVTGALALILYVGRRRTPTPTAGVQESVPARTA
jgi:signal peptidase I